MRLARTILIGLLATLSASPAPGAPGDADLVLARADSLFRAGQPDSALACVAPVLEQARLAGDQRIEMLAQLHRASALGVTGRSRDSSAAARDALRIARSLGDSSRVRLANRWIAFAVLVEGRTVEAESLYVKLADDARANGDVLELAYAHFGLAWIAFRAGNHQTAVREYREAAGAFATVGDTLLELDARIGLARALRQLGEFDEMREIYREILAREPDPAFRRARSAALNNLGAYEFESGDPGVAVECWTRALEELGPDPGIGARITPATNLALAWMELGAHADATRVLGQLREECEAAGDRERLANVLLLAASADLAKGDFTSGLAAYESVAAMDDVSAGARAEAVTGCAGAMGQLDRWAEVPGLLDRWREELGDGMTAGWRLEFGLLRAEALAALDRWQECRQSATEAEAVAIDLQLTRKRLRALLLRARAEAALGDADQAVASLRRAQAIWEDLRAVPRDPRWREQRSVLGREIHLDLARLLLVWPQDISREERVTAAFDLLQRYKSRTLRERMAGPDQPGSTGAVEPVQLDELRSDVLRAGELFVDLYLGDPVSLAFLVNEDRCDAFELESRRSWEDRARLLRDLVSDPGQDPSASAHMWRSSAALVGDALWGSLGSEIESDSVVILAADGALLALPLEWIPSDPHGERLGATVFRVPSATVLAGLRARKPGTDATWKVEVLGAWGEELAGASREVKWLGANFDDVRFSPGCADSNTTGEWGGASVLHVAGHADVFGQRPWASRIQLGIDPAGWPCYLTAAEVARMSLPVELAVISGCDTGSGRYLSGEGVLGLGSAFIAAGARVVVATLWPVDDAVTSWFMREFYTSLGSGASVADALLAAQDRVRAHAETAHPAYWAGFVAVGDATANVHLEVRDRWRSRAAILIGLALLAGAAIVLFGKRRPSL